MSEPKAKVSYASYLKLGEGYESPGVSGLLDCVTPASNQPEEHLFITVHHGFEVWFKQILFDFTRIKELINSCLLNINDKRMWQEYEGQIPKLLMRCRDLFRMLLKNFEVIESIGQLSFMNFRDYLMGGSGFQSLQFRLIENTFGLPREHRKHQDKYGYLESFRKDSNEMKRIEESEKNTIFQLVQVWLETILDQYNIGRGKSFAQQYCESVRVMGEDLLEMNKPAYDERTYEIGYQKAKSEKITRLTFKAFQGALLIHQFQEKPEYLIPYQIITCLLDIDEAIMMWRARHVHMVHRMIGRKTGTGGTDGVSYLSSTISDNYKVFLDLYNISTYIIPSYKFKEEN